MQFQVSPLPRAITRAVFAQNQSPGPVWKAETKPNLSGSKEKAKLILNAPNSEWKKQLDQFISPLLYFQECSLALFYGDGSQLGGLISQAFLGENTKFLCSLDWNFPEFFKTHPTFICSSFLRASRSLRTQTSVFSGTPCTCHSHIQELWIVVHTYMGLEYL